MRFSSFLFFILIVIPTLSHSQSQTLKQLEVELLAASNRLFLAYQNDLYDSVEIYNDELKTKMLQLLGKNPASLKYSFNTLIDSNAFHIVTSEDSMFRIYSWDTWTGGTMHFYNNIFQYSYKGKVITEFNELEEGDSAGFFSELFTLKAENKTYYFPVNNGRYSSKDMVQTIEIVTIDSGKLNWNVKLIRTTKGMTNMIGFEYDFFSVVDRPERPLKLIKYDKRQKIIFIPVVLDYGKVTNRFIQYKFNGKYFEKHKIQ